MSAGGSQPFQFMCPLCLSAVKIYAGKILKCFSLIYTFPIISSPGAFRQNSICYCELACSTVSLAQCWGGSSSGANRFSTRKNTLHTELELKNREARLEVCCKCYGWHWPKLIAVPVAANCPSAPSSLSGTDNNLRHSSKTNVNALLR